MYSGCRLVRLSFLQAKDGRRQASEVAANRAQPHAARSVRPPTSVRRPPRAIAVFCSLTKLGHLNLSLHCNCFALSPSSVSIDRSGMLPGTPCSSPSPLGQALHPPRRPCTQGRKPLPQQKLVQISNTRLTVGQVYQLGSL